MLIFKEKKFKDKRRNVEIKDYKNLYILIKRIFIYKIGFFDRLKDKFVYEVVESFYIYIIYVYYCDLFIYKIC